MFMHHIIENFMKSSDISIIKHYKTVTNLCGSSNVKLDEIEKSSLYCRKCCYQLFEIWKKAQHRKYLKRYGDISSCLIYVGYELLECWIGVIKSTTKQHAHYDVCHTRRDQFSHVKRTTLFLSHSLDHLFRFHQDPRLHHSLTESKPFQDGQA